MSSDSPVMTTVSARARASRINGARSRGPRTTAGKARSSRNALKHGLRAEKFLVLPEEDAAAFKALEAALLAELAPVGTLQSVLAQRVVSAAWRLARADRIEAEVLAERRFADGGLGLALIRDSNGSRTCDTVLRYRGAAMAEFLRALRTLQTLQAETDARAEAPPARRSAQPAIAERKEPEQPRHNNALATAPGTEPPTLPDRPQAAASKAPSAPTTEGRPAPGQRPHPKPNQPERAPRSPQLPAPGRSPHIAPDRNRLATAPAVSPSPIASTKQTRETPPK